jgi:hypothetical protein
MAKSSCGASPLRLHHKIDIKKKKKKTLGWSLASWLDGRSILWQKIHHFAILKKSQGKWFCGKLPKKKGQI